MRLFPPPSARDRNLDPPLRITAHAESFGITDAAGTIIAYVYFGVGDETQRQAAKRMTRDEAESVAKQIARALTDNQERQG